MGAPIAILDIDGTLVDSNYHHAIAWYRAFREHDLTLPVWRIHRHIGMGGDRLVGALAGESVEAQAGDAIRDDEARLYMDLIGEVAPLEGARELIVELKERGSRVVLASSAKPEEADHYVDLLAAREIVDGWTTSGDVDTTKPAPDVIQAALDKAGDGDAVMVGDSTWDALAAARAEMPCVAVLSGGYSGPELREAGATAVFDSLPGLLRELDTTPLGARLR